MPNNHHILFCYRCYHTWKKRIITNPKQCPKCKSPYWNKPRKRVLRGVVLKMKISIIRLHDAIVKNSGGELGIRDEGGIYNSTHKLLIHQNKNQMKPISIGAFALNEFARRHYFIDGNKRTAYAVAKVFMLINKCHLQINFYDAVKFILEVAKYESNLDLNCIKEWLKENCIMIEEKEIQNYLKDMYVKVMLGEEDEEE